MIKPISPAEITGKKRGIIPDRVINCWNTLIAEHWDGSCSEIELQEARSRVRLAMDFSESQEIPDLWLNIEDIYRAEGWIVEFDKPGFNESYKAKYIFSKKD